MHVSGVLFRLIPAPVERWLAGSVSGFAWFFLLVFFPLEAAANRLAKGVFNSQVTLLQLLSLKETALSDRGLLNENNPLAMKR